MRAANHSLAELQVMQVLQEHVLSICEAFSGHLQAIDCDSERHK